MGFAPAKSRDCIGNGSRIVSNSGESTIQQSQRSGAGDEGRSDLTAISETVRKNEKPHANKEKNIGTDGIPIMMMIWRNHLVCNVNYGHVTKSNLMSPYPSRSGSRSHFSCPLYHEQ
jgi:hypothetical protein